MDVIQEESTFYRAEEVEHKYFTMIPNVVDEMGLSPYAFSLYIHLKRRIGESDSGSCWEGSRATAKLLKMSHMMVCNARKELAACNPPLIRIEKKIGKHGNYDSITILDIWKYNTDYMVAKYKTKSDGVNPVYTPVNGVYRGVNQVIQKKNNITKTNKELIYSPIGEEESSSSVIGDRSLLEASSKYELRLMEVLTEEARAKRGGPVRKFKRFKSLAMKQMFDEAEERLGERTEEAIAAAMRAGCTSIKAAVYYVAAFGKNGKMKLKSSMIPAQSKPASDQEVEEEFRRLNPGVQLPGVQA